MSPPQRVDSIELLEPSFKLRFLQWLALAKQYHEIRITETRRSHERQLYLLRQGLSRTLQSKHIVGRAVDIVILTPDGKADWRPSVYRGLYRLVPLRPHGLQTIDVPGFVDLVHIEDLD